MPTTIIARVSSAAAAGRAATFCTSARAMKPAAESGAAAMHTGTSPSAAKSGGSAWAWRNLSPRTRQNVKVLGGVCVATDAFVLYNYPEWIGLKRAPQ